MCGFKNDKSLCIHLLDGMVADVTAWNMNHGEADTTIIIHGVHFTEQCDSLDVLHLWSPNTDVLHLVIGHKPLLLMNTSGNRMHMT